MKLINLLIRELDNCRFVGDFRVSRHAEICQFDRFSSEISFKRAGSCNYRIARVVQLKMKILYSDYIKVSILASVSFWPLLIIELVARVVPARLIIRQMERQMRDKWNFLHHPRLTSGGEGLSLS